MSKQPVTDQPMQMQQPVQQPVQMQPSVVGSTPGQPAYGVQQTQYGMQYAQPGMTVPGNIPGQPQQVVWMARPVVPGCPPGLEYLTQVDQLLIKQQIELLELMTGWETNNKYKVLNTMGQQVYFATEESDMCMRQCCGPQRGFVLHITDNTGQEIIKLEREFKCCAGCSWCACSDGCAHEISVEAPAGNVIGYVRQATSFILPVYSIQDTNRETLLNIEGPCCTTPCCCQDKEFFVQSADKTQNIGTITKQWSGCGREYFTDADNYGIKFPMDLDVRMKAVLLSAAFLIDFVYFEQKQNGRR